MSLRNVIYKNRNEHHLYVTKKKKKKKTSVRG